jgi:hypothetical protein
MNPPPFPCDSVDEPVLPLPLSLHGELVLDAPLDDTETASEWASEADPIRQRPLVASVGCKRLDSANFCLLRGRGELSGVFSISAFHSFNLI